MKGYSSKCTAFFVERHAVLSTQPSYVPIVHCGVGKHYIRPVGQFSKKIASFVGWLGSGPCLVGWIGSGPCLMGWLGSGHCLVG